MIAPLRELQALILDPGSNRLPKHHTDPFLARIRQALISIEERPDDVGPGDLAALLRQATLRCHLSRNEEPEIRVPNAQPWPDERTWQLFNCRVRPIERNYLLMRPEPWNPVWLDATASQVVDDAIAEIPRRRVRSVMGDPCLTEYTGLGKYFSPGQRDAVRGAFLMPAGSTLIINLPTGAGKTLAFQLPSLVWASEGALSLVIVPTIALARDQEERFRELLRLSPTGKSLARKFFAYHSGLKEESKKEILRDIRKGAIPILFTSPEAALGILRGPLFDAAQHGRLRFFIMDEAHVVSQWGQQFRPEFQSIAGLRESLLEVCPADGRFRTLLLTGTLAPESLQTLQQLFGGEECQIIAEPSLRCEPGFLVDGANSEEQRCQRVLEAIRHLPRPIILYTTLRDHAFEWLSILRSSGFRRVRLVRGGDLAGSEGEQLLRDWHTRAADIMVATSAFGLGVDQAEVRSVVHACLPETIDRYYQEVGRAGRDGNAAVALLVTTPSDLETARNLSQEKLISVDRGFERWEAMWIRQHAGSAESHILSLDNRPADIAVPGVWNASWNLRTLVLMARARLIQFAAHLPPIVERKADEDDASLQERWRKQLEKYWTEVSIRILDPKAVRQEHWEAVVDRAREDLRTADSEALKLLGEVLSFERPLNDIFRDVYTLFEPFLRPPYLAGSCPVTRRAGSVSFESTEPEIVTLNRVATSMSLSFQKAVAPCYDHTGRAWIEYDSHRTDSGLKRDRLFQFLRYFVSAGGIELSIPDGYLDIKEWRQLREGTPFRFLIRTPMDTSVEEPLQPHLPVPRLTILSGSETRATIIKPILQVKRPFHIIVLPATALDPDRPARRLLDMKPRLTLEEVLDRLAQ